MEIALIICSTIVCLFTIAALTFKWFISFDKETTRKNIKNKIQQETKKIADDFEAIQQKNIELFEKELSLKEQEIEQLQKYIDRLVREINSEVSRMPEPDIEPISEFVTGSEEE